MIHFSGNRKTESSLNHYNNYTQQIITNKLINEELYYDLDWLVSRNGLLYRVQFIKTIAFCPRWYYRKQTEQSVHDRLIFGVTNL